MGHTPVQELSLKIQSELEEGIYDWDRFQGGNRDTSWRICNSLAFALNGSDIEFLAGEVHSFEEAEVEIAAYTKQHLIYYRGNPDKTGPSFRVVSRRTISEVVIHSAPKTITVPRFSIASMGAYEVFYGDGIHFNLPLGRRNVNPERLDSFIPSLVEDLLK